MKGLFLGGAAAFIFVASASAADLPRAMPMKAPAALATYDWNGLYIGGYWGAAVSQANARSGTFSPQTETHVDHAGWTAGGQIGYNWQWVPTWMIGLEADLGYLGIDRTFADWNEFSVVGVKSTWMGTVRGRVGYVAGPSVLYATAGVAFVHIEDTFGGSLTAGIAPVTQSTTKTGFVGGAGIETKLSQNWSTKTEYLYVNVGDVAVTSNPFGVPDATTFQHSFHMFKSGLNYRFGGPSEPLPFFDFNGALLGPARQWSGLYVGGNIGGALSLTRIGGGRPDIVPARLGETDLNGAGFAGGAQIGYNLMFGPKFFVGVEGDIGYLGLDDTQHNFNDNFVFSQTTDWYGTIRGRIGSTTGPALLYLTGGAAFVHTKDSFRFAAGTPTIIDETTKTLAGWTFGGGTEVALDSRWSAKLEYLYVDVGTQDHNVPAITTTFANFDHRFQLVRAGLNYRFGSDDIVSTRY